MSYSPIMMLEQDVANHLKAFASVNMLQEEEAGKTYYTNPGSIFGPIVPQVDCKVEEILLSRAYARVRIVVLNMLPYDIAEVPNAAGDAASFETFLDEYKNIESPLASEGYNFNTPNTHPSTLHKRPARLLYELADHQTLATNGYDQIGLIPGKQTRDAETRYGCGTYLFESYQTSIAGSACYGALTFRPLDTAKKENFAVAWNIYGETPNAVWPNLAVTCRMDHWGNSYDFANRWVRLLEHSTQARDGAQDVYKNHDDFITDQSTMGTEVCITASVTTDAIPGSASDTRGVTIFVLLEEEHTVTQAEEDAGHAGDILSGLDGGPFG